MSTYLNSGLFRFQETLNAKIYIDKSELISVLNEYINTPQKYICVSRPRRFGKSVTANMLSAYYSKNLESAPLFDNLDISSHDSYKKHLNQYNTIFINMTDEFNRASQNVAVMIRQITELVINEIKVSYPDYIIHNESDLALSMQSVFDQSHTKFVIIIDEWDCIMREKKEDLDGLKLYLEWLKLIMKDKEYLALAYMTGILPIKKYGSNSALNMFREYSMTSAGKYAPYIGFTEDEVKSLCSKYSVDLCSMKKWYDGYSFKTCSHLFNPNSVVCAIDEESFVSYWTLTETFESLRRFIDLNMEGLRDDIVNLIARNEVVVNTANFHNDMATFETKDDVLTLLIHLGYLAINPESDNKLVDNNRIFAVRIPNEEIRYEFRDVTKENKNYSGVYKLINQSLDLLEDIWEMRIDRVAEAFDTAHQDHTSILKYNDENSLSWVISLALYLGTVDTYSVYRELPAGKGFADMVYLPKQGIDKPALLVELKYDKSAVTAIDQIKQKNYGRIFRDYKGKVLLVGINYDKDTKDHQCLIESMQI